MVRLILALTWCMAITGVTVRADASGTWALTSPLLPPNLTCEFDVKDGTLLGSCAAGNARLPIRDGQISGNSLRWTISVPSDTGITTLYDFTGELDGPATSLTGSVTYANETRTQIEKAEFTAVRR